MKSPPAPEIAISTVGIEKTSQLTQPFQSCGSRQHQPTSPERTIKRNITYPCKHIPALYRHQHHPRRLAKSKRNSSLQKRKQK
ncbi:hypothetical protein DPMN_178391 [Dreissena polymorpha]|uniref:Uncharacterized protein n=1 Tax=Dreissena polymorpha TaxID=45954 RepID=A0A9D4EF45_DREPO|nr:hypothetical protein DPMN_178391 [Dreissena polymorpha]